MTVVTLQAYKFKVPLSQTFTLSRQTLHAVGQLWIKTNATPAGCSTSPATLLLLRSGMSYNAGTLLTYLSRALYLYIVCLNTYTDE